MALRNIVNYKTDDILRKKAKSVEKIDDKLLTLLDDMAETMYEANGVGLAGPQVGVLKRIVVVDVGTGLFKLINPVIEKAEGGEEEDTEGCLSFPQIYGKVKRPQKVIVKALNEKGENITLEATDLLARAFCHEIDHLDGVLFIDKVIKGTLVNISFTEEQKDK
jgi:peptide deformylase